VGTNSEVTGCNNFQRIQKEAHLLLR